MTETKSFEAQIRDFESMVERRALAIIQTASQSLFSAAQTPQASVKETGGSFEEGKIPVDFGDLRGSFISGLNGSQVAGGTDAYVMAIAQSKIGDEIFGGWTADHALPIEYGTEDIEPRRFVGANAERWQEFVDDAVRESQSIR